MEIPDDAIGERLSMETLQVKEEQMKKLATVLKNSRIRIFEYIVDEDTLVVYDDRLQIDKTIKEYIDYIDRKSKIHPEDREKIKQLYKKAEEGLVEIREIVEDGTIHRSLVELTKMRDGTTGKLILVGSSKDITEQKEQEKRLKEEARKDALTSLYNKAYGKKKINQYLNDKNPFEACGMIVLDVDYFKSVNDRYGHLFGDKVLVTLCDLLREKFDQDKTILVRAGGDEFVIFVKDTSNINLVQKNVELMQSIRELTFDQSDYKITCSAGVCYLPANMSGYTYDQLFENADIALYKAKERGRNRYIYCDSLQHFTTMTEEHDDTEEIEARYYQNDIVATTFEIFEKMNNFEVAINLLLKVIGTRLGLDRISVIQTDIKSQEMYSDYQWVRKGTSKVLTTVRHFEKEDFLKAFDNYDENGVMVLHYDEIEEYSEESKTILMPQDTKTAIYTAMYCEGRYTGTIAYVVCKEKRNWSNDMVKQLSEVTKIISAHFAKNEVMNHAYRGAVTRMEHDTLTGLISFGRFHEEVERIILANKTNNYMMIYTDFENFKYFNYKYGYTIGDQLLKDFCSSVISKSKDKHNLYFTRVVSDQFLLFRTARYGKDNYEKIVEETNKINEEFMLRQKERFPKSNVKLRTGIYYITPECMSASYAIDAANYARQKVDQDGGKYSVRFYDEEMRKQRALENQIINEMKEAMEQQQFKVYLQPKYSVKDREITGAEALIRWERENGEVLSPNSFIPVYENNGKIVELDFYVFETVVKFIAKNLKEGKKQVPISINASSLHATDPQTIDMYMNILNKYEVDPAYVEIELTETAVVSEYESVRELFDEFQLHGIKTAMDDFGSGYSILNTIVDIPVDVIKIDRGFITSCLESDRGIYFLKHLIDMIRNLGYQLICEGVETDQQIEVLKQIGCDEIQGYWYSKPLKMEAYEKLLETERISNWGGAKRPNRQKRIKRIYH